jgi:tetratricopeptide (TPR) repeat protein
MRMKTIILLLLFCLGTVGAEIEFQLQWQKPGNVTSMYVSDLNDDGYQEILLTTGSSHEKMVNTPTGPGTAMVCEGEVSQMEAGGTLIWEKKLCRNDNAQDPCYNNGCISTIYADTVCTNTNKSIFVGCCYCGVSSVIRVFNSEGKLIHELYDHDGAGNPVPISGCIRKILASDIDADNCKEIIAATNLELFIWDTDCQTCTIPQIPALRTIDLPVVDRPSGTIYDFIVVNFDDDANLTREIVVAADEVSVYEHDLTLKWQYEIDTSRPVRAIYAYDLDSDTAAHEIDQDPDLEPELVVGESWYIYVLDNIEYGNTDPTDDVPNLKWEYSTSPYDVNTVFADKYIGHRNVMGGSASIVHILDYNGSVLETFNAPNEVRKLDTADFDKNGQKELVVFSNNYISVFSTTEMIWNSSNFQGSYIQGVTLDINLDGYPEIVAGYTLGLYVVGVTELKEVVGSEADRLYNMGKDMLEKGKLVEAIIYFEQARAKFEETGNTFMAIQCQKQISECEKSMDTDRITAVAMEELRNYGYDNASYLFGEAANLYARMGDKNKMSQMRVLKEAAEKLWQAHATLLEAHDLLLDEEYAEARVEATWAQHSFEDVSNLFLTMSLDSVYETLKLEISARIRECDEIKDLCDQFTEAESLKEEADQYNKDGERYFKNQQYSEARQAYEQAKEYYTEAAQQLDEIQISLGKRVDSFRRDIQDIQGKIKTLEESEIYKTYGDIETRTAISDLEEKISGYEDLIDEYGDLAESMERKARECRTKAASVTSQSGQSYSFGDQFFAYVREIAQPPTSLVVGLALLIVALVGLAAGKGRYVALAFLVVVLIFLGVVAFQLTMH